DRWRPGDSLRAVVRLDASVIPAAHAAARDTDRAARTKVDQLRIAIRANEGIAAGGRTADAALRARASLQHDRPAAVHRDRLARACEPALEHQGEILRQRATTAGEVQAAAADRDSLASSAEDLRGVTRVDAAAVSTAGQGNAARGD